MTPIRTLAQEMAAVVAQRKIAANPCTGYTVQMLSEEIGIAPKAMRRILRKLASAGLLNHQHRDRWSWASSDDEELVAIRVALSGHAFDTDTDTDEG